MKRAAMASVWMVAAALSACAAEAPPETSEPAGEQRVASAAGLRIEQAERELDRGGDARAVVDQLTAALDEPALTAAERQAAVLALSRAYELSGAREPAITVVEAEIAAHAEERGFDRDGLERRLRTLLTGSEVSPPNGSERDEPAPPFAHVVAHSFVPGPSGAVQATFYLAGGDNVLSDELGTFNVRGALRDEQEKECPLCEVRLDVSCSAHRSDWLIIPEQQQRFDEAFLVFYFDLGRNRIPARYEQYLPMKVADIVAELEQNRSFVVAKERPGAPPALLLAAPRTVMLDDVERHLVGMDSLPTELTYVDVPTNLRPNEIRSAMRRQWFPKVRACYDELLKRDSDAGGKIVLSFRIEGTDGSVQDLGVRIESGELQDGRFLDCVRTSADGITFPAMGSGSTTVSYPVEFSPK